MEIGVSLPVMEPGWNREHFLCWCRRIDRGPFSSLSLGERIAYSNPEFITALAAAAAVTEHVRLLATVMVLPLHRPVIAAKQLATIDMLSNGRLSVGVGIGGRTEDYAAAQVSLDQRRQAVLAQQVATLRRVWRGDHAGDPLRHPVQPAPVQRGGPPLLAGAMGPRAIDAAATWADGVVGFSFGPDVGEIAQYFRRVREAWQRAGRSTAPRLIVGFWYALGDGGRDQLARHLRRYLNWLDAAAIEQLLPTTGFAGSQTELLQLLCALAAVGADEVILTPTTLDESDISQLTAVSEAFRSIHRQTAKGV